MDNNLKKSIDLIPIGKQQEIRDRIISDTKESKTWLYNRIAGITPISEIDRMYFICVFKEYGIDYSSALPIFSR